MAIIDPIFITPPTVKELRYIGKSSSDYGYWAGDDEYETSEELRELALRKLQEKEERKEKKKIKKLVKKLRKKVASYRV